MGLGHDGINMDVGRWLSSEMSGSCYGKGTVTTIVEICPLVTVSFARSKKLIEDLNDLNGYIPYEEQKRQLKHANYSIFRTKQKIVESLPDLVSFRLYSGQYLER